MRDKWYSDNRDLIKWSVLLLLARRHRADRIVQVAFWNKSEFAEIGIGRQRHQIPKEVLSHFRNIRNVAGLSSDPNITVFDLPFHEPERDSYFVAVRSFIASLRKERCVICMDPDVGLEPKRGAGQQHVKNQEAREMWDAIPAEWIFVIYQNETNKAGKPWIEPKRQQFAKAIGLPLKYVGVASAPKLAKDVVLFFAKKPSIPRWVNP